MAHYGMMVVSDTHRETNNIIRFNKGTIYDYVLDKNEMDKNLFIPFFKKDGSNTYFAEVNDIDWDKTINESNINIIADRNEVNQIDFCDKQEFNDKIREIITHGKYVEFFDAHI